MASRMASASALSHSPSASPTSSCHMRRCQGKRGCMCGGVFRGTSDSMHTAQVLSPPTHTHTHTHSCAHTPRVHTAATTSHHTPAQNQAAAALHACADGLETSIDPRKRKGSGLSVLTHRPRTPQLSLSRPCWSTKTIRVYCPDSTSSLTRQVSRTHALYVFVGGGAS